MANRAVSVTDLMTHIDEPNRSRFIQRKFISDGVLPVEHTDPSLLDLWNTSFWSSDLGFPRMARAWRASI